ncbi:hypothetical protein R3P38DRAFT_3239357 [Favolaschia claudopus]|uniref:Uncharacterized protein n=1 Tax=Favolaschia claudopus TaxID=2862362 RepID=A0AAV9Z8Q8_9AGAR
MDDTCTDINKCRTLYDIVWACLTTIFACIWVSVHPNMPPQPAKIPHARGVRSSPSWCRQVWERTPGLRRRLKMMLAALIAPEILVGLAARQWFAARKFCMIATEKGHEVSLIHGFFYTMGGFVDAEDHPIVDIEEIPDSVLVAIEAIPEAAIQDKSKRDGLAKLLAITQILRVVAQSLARWNQHLAITSLELATVAYAVVTTFMWFFWLKKPIDTHTTIQIVSVKNDDSVQRFTPEMEWSQAQARARARDPVDRFIGMLLGYYDNFDASKFKTVPSFFSPSSSKFPSRESKIAFRIECTVAVGFGGIHCIAWNTKFPSVAEKWIWRSSVVAVTGVPVAWLVAMEAGFGYYKNAFLDGLRIALWCLAFLAVPLYVIARLFLLVLPFTALRSIEPAVFIDIDWGKYIPHL